MSKKSLTLSMEEQKIRDLKKKAIDAGITLSDYLSVAGTITNTEKIQQFIKSNSGVPPQTG